MTPLQCRMARAGLGLGVRELADKAQVSTNTITRMERGDALQPRTVEAIRSALETEGVVFIDQGAYSGDAGPGVRLK